ncbi:heat shock 70 kDa protein 12B-like [Saccostrea echinata]|uniref:heat shock 70 kDa protein 12B-like n=1 Tax=Saccostrea echinata TaxID=191078 RepID=UPI002A839F5F|nr:heat shock 70 kDa protein 12B-like [Saccostrea echinata]
MICAIDLGTSYSGYAFAPRENLTNNGSEIYASHWESEVLSQKTPTAILLDPVMNFQAFGHAASKKFSKLTEDEKDADWFYFKDFKMDLYDMNLTRHSMIQDIHGKYASAQKIFAESLKFLRGHFLDMLQGRNMGILEEFIFYVVTVPAIWNDGAKQFMREAAVMAGMCPHRLDLALEPEAAALYCKRLTSNRTVESDEPPEFVVDQPYIVVDLGGGTSDITIQKVSPDGKIQNLYKASGGPWGGNKVNKCFLELFVELFGDSLFHEFCKENMDEFFDLLQNIEIKKRWISEDKNETISLDIPNSLMDLYAKSLETAIKNAKLDEMIKARKRNKINVSCSYFQTHFKEICDQTINLVKTMVEENAQCQKIKTLMMVGGFSESKLVQSIFRESFPGYDIKIPLDAGLAVLKGAVIFGFDRSVIQTRICPYTYGIAVLKKFNPHVHDVSKSFLEDGQWRADDCFEKFFEVGEPLAIGTKRSIGVNISHVGEDRQKDRREHKEIEVFSSSLQSPLYTTDPTCRSHGMISVNPPEGEWPVYVRGRVEIEVTGTDFFNITYIDDTTGHKTSGTVDFLL